MALLSAGSICAQYTYPQSITFGPLSDQTLGTAPFAISATASSSLPVAFNSNSSGVCAVSGNMVSLANTGTCSITATQPGDSYFSAAPPVTRSFNVLPAAKSSQTIKFVGLTDQTMGAAPFQISASASSGLSVTLTSNTPGVCTVSGNMLSIVGAGTGSITANQPGNDTYNPATPVTQTFTVNKGSQTITFSPLGPHGGADGPIPLQATASSGLPVTFSVVSGPATVSGATLSLTGVGSVTVQASQAGTDNYNAASPVTQTFAVSLAAPMISLVLNAASYGSGTVAPGSIAVLFGASFDAQSSINGPVTAKVTFKDAKGVETPASMLYSDFQQINFLVPAVLAGGQATLTVSNSAGASMPYPVKLGAVAPGLFTADASGQGAPAAQALVVAADGTQSTLPVAQCTGTPVICTTVAIPMASGTQVYLILYGTGIRGRSSVDAVTLAIGGAAGHVTYAGPQNDFAGLDQIDVLVPASLAGMGEVDLKLTVDNLAANTVRVRFQ